ncbi:polysaccharide deacetylase family protein [Falsibacillus pallidus]|uniref:polysaccharide deacetylase family protein n=1 Tax=Falsibacillus pallidus TaxID=493781 RepID=UPI003D973B1E
MFVSLFIFAEKANAASGIYFKATAEHTDVFDNRSKSLVKIGELSKGETYLATRRYGLVWYEIQFGKIKGYVFKGDTALSTKGNLTKQAKHLHPLGEIKISKTAVIVDNSTGTLVPFGKINNDIVFPVVSRTGNWVGIEMGGRLGFVYKDKIYSNNSQSPEKEFNAIPVLMYHHLLKKSENTFIGNNVILNVENFAEQMKYLHDNGYHTITLEQLESYLKGTLHIKEKTVAITFDDGHKTNYLYAYPILKKYGFHAAAFIITSRTSASPVPFNPSYLQFLSSPEMEEMKSDGTFEFGSHTNQLHDVTGRKSNVLLKPENDVLDDFKLSKELLQTQYFCYPFGQYSPDTIRLAKEAGYTMAFLASEGYAQPKIDLMKVPRFGIYPYTTMDQFAKIVSGTYNLPKTKG